jgi:hypothetical protein
MNDWYFQMGCETGLYAARDLARGLASMGGKPFEPSEIEREDNQIACYAAEQERLERNYIGPKAAE